MPLPRCAEARWRSPRFPAASRVRAAEAADPAGHDESCAAGPEAAPADLVRRALHERMLRREMSL